MNANKVNGNGFNPRSYIDMRRMPQPFDSSDIPVVTHHQQGDYMTTKMPYKPNDYTLHPMSMSVLGF